MLQLGLTLNTFGASPRIDLDLVLEAERRGFESVWAGEAYGPDAVTPVTWVLARTTRIKAGTGIMQMPARTPTCAAMTAMTLQALSGNRFLCGVGPSGPQVIEGWHGVAYGKPLERTREYIEIIKQVLAREKPLEHAGMHYRIPYDGPDASGLGKPLKSIVHAAPGMKFYMASITPGGLRLAGEIADGNIPIFMSPEKADVVVKPTLAGMAKGNAANPGGAGGGGRTLADFDIAPHVKVRIGDDIAACRDAIRPELALYIGGMGARDRNFYTDFASRMGYEAEARKIQDLFLAGHKKEAAAAVPDALIDEIALIGPPARIRDRMQAWKAIAREDKVRTLILTGATMEAVRLCAEAAFG
jgi:F420-dependent oxidoreductase-like protein